MSFIQITKNQFKDQNWLKWNENYDVKLNESQSFKMEEYFSVKKRWEAFYYYFWFTFF